MAENLENEFQGTPINLKDFGLGAFSDDEFDFLKKKPKPEEKKIPVGELAEEPLSEPPLAPPVPETTVPETTVPETAISEATISETAVSASTPPPAEPPPPEPAVAPETSAEPVPKEKEPEPEFVQAVHEHQVGEIVKCKIVRVEENGLLVDFGFKTEGLIDPANIFMKSGDTLEKLFQVGGEIEATVISLEPRDGYVLLSKKQADIERAWAAAYDAFKNKKILEAQVISSVKGGLVVDFHRLRGFIPASQIFKEASSTGLEKLVGETLPIKVIEINRQQNKIIFSHRLAAEEVKKFSEEKIFSEVEVGQVRRGRVSSIKSFGVFVDLGGVEGLVHISELTWGRIKHPSEVVKIGDEVEVFILGINQDKKKISLGLRQLQPDPWVKARDLYRVGQIVRGKVVRLVKFGAFVELEKGLEGLLHLSEMKDPSPSRPEEAVKIGEEVQVKILRIVPEEQKIGLSLKAAQEEAAKEKAKESAVVEERKVTIGDLMKEKNIQLESVQPPATEAPEPPPQI